MIQEISFFETLEGVNENLINSLPKVSFFKINS